MSRKFISGILAITLGLTTFAAAPARANNDDLGRFLGAAATVFIIGKIIEDAHDGNRQVRVHTRHAPRSHVQPRPRLEAVQPRPSTRRGLLPKRCMIGVRGGGTRYVMGKRCMEKHYRGARALPGNCLVSVKTRNGRGNAYSLRCLRGRGYQVAHR